MEPFPYGVRPIPTEHQAPTGRPHCLLWPQYCGMSLVQQKIVNLYFFFFLNQTCHVMVKGILSRWHRAWISLGIWFFLYAITSERFCWDITVQYCFRSILWLNFQGFLMDVTFSWSWVIWKLSKFLCRCQNKLTSNLWYLSN